MGTKPYKGRYWAYSRENMETFLKEGRLYFPKNGGTPSYKRYLDEMPGVPLQNDWSDVKPKSSSEDLGYPTQKPLALLERIVEASSRPGDLVLDPFCGCGTAVHAAHKLQRRWIGVDVTHLAISLIEKRLKDAFPYDAFEVFGSPKDYAAAVDLAARDKYQFQWWACSLVNAQPYAGKKKGPDGGIDGLIYFMDSPDERTPKKIVVSVKGGAKVDVTMIRELIATVEAAGAQIGLFVCLTEPTDPMRQAALKAGVYHCDYQNRDYPRVQILTVSQLLSGERRPEYPDFTQGAVTFKRAKRERKADAQHPLL